MMGKLFGMAFKTVAGRWVTLGLVTLLLGGAGIKWHNFKEDLIHKGQQVCVQEINKDTVDQLRDALAAEKSARADLIAKAAADAAVSESARNRHRDLQDQLSELERAMEKQRKTDETYKAWSDAPLPDGVAARLLNHQAAASNPSSVRDDQD